MIKNMSQLITEGYLCIPCYNPSDLQNIRLNLQASFKEFPEYIGNDYICGGFSAFGNPSSFHHPTIRDIRHHCFHTSIQHIPTELSHLRKELLFDRLLFRRKGQKPPAESWHRDISPPSLKLPTDTILQGWVNLDDTNQYFSACPTTHLQNTDEKGFAKIDKNEHQKYKQLSQRITIPPGHIILFNQTIVHEIVSNIAKTDIYRIFFGIRFTTSETPLFDNSKIITQQGVPYLPSGQLPPIYSINHLTIFMNKQFGNYKNLEDFCISNFKDSVLINYTSKKNNTTHKICPRYLPSLSQLNLPLFTPYTSQEIQLYTPH